MTPKHNGPTHIQTSGSVGAIMLSALVRARVDVSTATKYALVAQDVYLHIQSSPQMKDAIAGYRKFSQAKDVFDLVKNSNSAMQADRLMTNASSLGLASGAFRAVRAARATVALSAGVDLIDALAKKNGVELNPCALSISKVSLDFAGALAGGATAWTGFGAVVAIMSIYAVGTDSYSLGVSCIDPVLNAATSR